MKTWHPNFQIYTKLFSFYARPAHFFFFSTHTSRRSDNFDSSFSPNFSSLIYLETRHWNFIAYESLVYTRVYNSDNSALLTQEAVVQLARRGLISRSIYNFSLIHNYRSYWQSIFFIKISSLRPGSLMFLGAIPMYLFSKQHKFFRGRFIGWASRSIWADYFFRYGVTAPLGHSILRCNVVGLSHNWPLHILFFLYLVYPNCFRGFGGLDISHTLLNKYVVNTFFSISLTCYQTQKVTPFLGWQAFPIKRWLDLIGGYRIRFFNFHAAVMRSPIIAPKVALTIRGFYWRNSLPKERELFRGVLEGKYLGIVAPKTYRLELLCIELSVLLKWFLLLRIKRRLSFDFPVHFKNPTKKRLKDSLCFRRSFLDTYSKYCSGCPSSCDSEHGLDSFWDELLDDEWGASWGLALINAVCSRILLEHRKVPFRRLSGTNIAEWAGPLLMVFDQYCVDWDWFVAVMIRSVEFPNKVSFKFKDVGKSLRKFFGLGVYKAFSLIKGPSSFTKLSSQQRRADIFHYILRSVRGLYTFLRFLKKNSSNLIYPDVKFGNTTKRSFIIQSFLFLKDVDLHWFNIRNPPSTKILSLRRVWCNQFSLYMKELRLSLDLKLGISPLAKTKKVHLLITTFCKKIELKVLYFLVFELIIGTFSLCSSLKVLISRLLERRLSFIIYCLLVEYKKRSRFPTTLFSVEFIFRKFVVRLLESNSFIRLKLHLFFTFWRHTRLELLFPTVIRGAFTLVTQNTNMSRKAYNRQLFKTYFSVKAKRRNKR